MQEEATHAPLRPEQLKPARYFAASFAGEHVAGTEFVIGALFVSWGVGALDVIIGLVIGNVLAILSWVLICAPIATATRLTLYAYLEKICGPRFIVVYSAVNGTLFCVLGGAMITVSASAARIPFGIPPQVEWYPTSIGFIAVALGVGAIVTLAANRGFAAIARFSEYCAPWLIAIFFIGAIAMLPVLMQDRQMAQLSGPGDFLRLAEAAIWIERPGETGLWHVAALAWGANLAFHGALGDMTILRFARRPSYAWFSAIGMLIGHFGAWLAAGVMGAAAAVLLKTELTAMDAGEVAYQALGIVGIWAVILAGWTTSNPTIYRAGLAFQSIHPTWSRERMTVLVGVLTTGVSCFPFVFTGLLGFLGIMALVMAPIGGIVIAEHYLLRRIGIPPFWREARGDRLNLAAAGAWLAALALCAALHWGAGVHVLFLFVPGWVAGLAAYVALCALIGARSASWAPYEAFSAASALRQLEEDRHFRNQAMNHAPPTPEPATIALIACCGASVIASFVLAAMVWPTGARDTFLRLLPFATVPYFLGVALFLLRQRGRGRADG